MSKYVNYSNNRCPPPAKLAEGLSIDIETAKEVRELWKSYSKEAILSRYEATRDWYNQCYHKPKIRELRRNAISELLQKDGYCGVGTLGRRKSQPGVWVHSLNSGDSYNPTLVFAAGNMFISSEADLLESGYVREFTNDDLIGGV